MNLGNKCTVFMLQSVLWISVSGENAYLSESWAMLSGRPTQPTCVEIPRNFTLCHGIDYTKMRLPNLLEHETMSEVTQQGDSWVALLNVNCHTDTQLFLCSLFAPVCLDREILPCRSLCEAVKAGCEKRMRNYGFPWPEMLNCRKFPVTNDMCIKPRIEYATPVNDTQCGACDQVGTYENILDHFCRSQYVLKVKIRSVESNHVRVRRGRAFKPRNSGERMNNFRNTQFFFAENKSHCPCHIQPSDLRRRFLVMATQGPHGQFVANLILPWKKEKAFKRSVRMFKKLNCQTLGTQIRERARRERTQHYRKTHTPETPNRRRTSYSTAPMTKN